MAKDIVAVIRRFGAGYTHFNEFNDLAKKAAAYLADGNVVGWFQVRMEFGPRSLGARSIMEDARDPEMQK